MLLAPSPRVKKVMPVAIPHPKMLVNALTLVVLALELNGLLRDIEVVAEGSVEFSFLLQRYAKGQA